MLTRVAIAVLLASATTTMAQESNTPPPAVPVQPIMPPKPAAVPVPTGEPVQKAELAGGLLVEDIKLGEGFEVKPGGAVVCFYHGTLKEGGKVFDSAFDRGEPIAFPLSGVIKGWQEGVPGMKVGGVRRLTVPAAMAYGPSSPSPDIPPNSDLVFVIQLVDAIKVEEMKEGEGEAASDQCVAVTNHTITDKDGKELEKTEAGKPYIWFPGELQGASFGIAGMKAGGKRRVTVPKEFNLGAPGMHPNVPQDTPIVIEFELQLLRNLPRQRGH